jgi:hypothetical protein
MIEILREATPGVLVRVLEVPLKPYCIARAWEICKGNRRQYQSHCSFYGVEYGEIATKITGTQSKNQTFANEMVRRAFPEIVGHPEGNVIHFPVEEVRKIV